MFVKLTSPAGHEVYVRPEAVLLVEDAKPRGTDLANPQAVVWTQGAKSLVQGTAEDVARELGMEDWQT